MLPPVGRGEAEGDIAGDAVGDAVGDGDGVGDGECLADGDRDGLGADGCRVGLGVPGGDRVGGLGVNPP